MFCVEWRRVRKRELNEVYSGTFYLLNEERSVSMSGGKITRHLHIHKHMRTHINMCRNEGEQQEGGQRKDFSVPLMAE